MNMDLQDSDGSQEGQIWITGSSFLRTPILTWYVALCVSDPSLKIKAMGGSRSGRKILPSSCRNQAGHGRYPRVGEAVCSPSIAEVQALGTDSCGFETSLSPLTLGDAGLGTHVPKPHLLVFRMMV